MLLLKTGQRKGVSRCSKLYTKLEKKGEKKDANRKKETRVRQIEILVFQGIKLVCAQEYKLKTAAENTKVGRRRCRGKSDTTKKKDERKDKGSQGKGRERKGRSGAKNKIKWRLSQHARTTTRVKPS